MDCKQEFSIRYNHVGYGTGYPKVFYVAMPMGVQVREASFRILDAAEKVALEGNLERRGDCGYTGETLFEGDFSALAAPGKYRIAVLVVGVDGNKLYDAESFLFEISDNLFEHELKANIKSFYFQRSGVELPAEFAGKWARPAAHKDDCLEFHSIMNREGTWNAHGGWYDAGDYGKYIVNGGVSVGTLLLACEMCPSGAGIMGGEGFVPTFEQPCSLLDEIRFELEFFLRMQDSDGGVFFKVTPGHWDGFVTPTDSDVMQKRYIMGKSTTSTLNFAGALAQAHRVFKAAGGIENESFATRCLAASLRAYRWALENPAVEWPHNTEGSGGYGDEHVEDEFFWARAMLYRELGGEGFPYAAETPEERLMQDMEKNPVEPGLSWRDTQNFGWIALALNDATAPAAVKLREKARAAIVNAAEAIIALQRDDAYSLSIRKFMWGSNGEIANHALTLLVAYSWTRDRRYRDAAVELVNFIYGRNPVNVSFVTGSAWSSPVFPHHRICHSDGIVDPIPGLLVGGINSDRQDMHRKPQYPNELPGFSYTDERCSFASNETAINWNAPLTAVLAMLRSL
jgi:Glycosyl hydrolase family 9./N-terminal ig-like domain of cellulase.